MKLEFQTTSVKKAGLVDPFFVLLKPVGARHAVPLQRTPP